MGDLEVLDDTDPHIVYFPTGSWRSTALWNAWGVSNGSVHYAIVQGSTASLNFTGNYIGVSFFMYQAGANCTIYVDGTQIGHYQTQVLDPTQQGPKMLFEKSDLDSSQGHKVTVEVDLAAGWVSPIPGQGAAILYIDGFSVAANGVSATDSGVPSPTGSGGGSSPSVTPTSTTGPALSGKTTSRTSKPAIVGGILGGLAALALIIAVMLFCLRRQRKKDTTTNHIAAYPNSSTVNAGLITNSSQTRSFKSLLRISSVAPSSSSIRSPMSEPSYIMAELGRGHPGLTTNQVLDVSPAVAEPPTAALPLAGATPVPMSGKQRVETPPRESSSDRGLRQELDSLREEVRRLTAMRSASPTGSGFSNQERPPEYEPGRSSRGTSTVTSTTRSGR